MNTYVVPTLGGPSRKMVTDVAGAVTFSPDGKQMAYPRTINNQSDQLLIANADGTDEHVVLERKWVSGQNGFNIDPSWSSTGDLIAIGAHKQLSIVCQSILVVRPNGELVKELVLPADMSGLSLAWMPDMSGMLLIADSAATEHRWQIWFLEYPSGNLSRITNDFENYQSLSLPADGKSIITAQQQQSSAIFVADVPTKLNEKTEWKWRQVSNQPAPGATLSWTGSGRLLEAEYGGQVYESNADGSGRSKILETSDYLGAPMGCGPGESIIIFRWSEKHAIGLWWMNLASGESRPLTEGDSGWVSDCTPDGKWLVYVGVGKDRSTTRLYKLSTEGGTPIELAKDVLQTLKVSPNGKTVAYMRVEGQGTGTKLKFVTQKLDGNELAKEIEAPPGSEYLGWTPDGAALTYLLVEENARNLWVQPLKGGAPVRLLHFDEEPSLIRAYRISADGKKIAITRAKFNDTDVVMFSNFR